MFSRGEKLALASERPSDTSTRGIYVPDLNYRMTTEGRRSVCVRGETFFKRQPPRSLLYVAGFDIYAVYVARDSADDK